MSTFVVLKLTPNGKPVEIVKDSETSTIPPTVVFTNASLSLKRKDGDTSVEIINKKTKEAFSICGLNNSTPQQNLGISLNSGEVMIKASGVNEVHLVGHKMIELDEDLSDYEFEGSMDSDEVEKLKIEEPKSKK